MWTDEQGGTHPSGTDAYDIEGGPVFDQVVVQLIKCAYAHWVVTDLQEDNSKIVCAVNHSGSADNCRAHCFQVIWRAVCDHRHN